MKMNIFLKIILIFLCLWRSNAENLISDGKVCDGLDVREISDFNILQGCQIIEGSVKIHLKEKLIPENFDNLTFPQLTEIAGYLMVYKVSGLKSVSQFFPNLVTIRGGELFKTYALIINGNPDLEDIGLSHLKTITSGAVRIEKNSMLCYVNTVDWSTILNNETYGKSLFNENMETKLCPLCDKGVGSCWNQQKPQVQCDCGGNSCNVNGTCCSPSCLSCRDDNKKDCAVCRQFIAGIYPSQKCVESCPYRSYEYLNHRCITVQECQNLNINSASDVPFIPFQGICREGCPEDFQIKYAVSGNKMSASCKVCLGKECWRRCKTTLVDSVEAAETLKGCQVVDGFLDIQMKTTPGVNVEKVLTESLSEIVEIEDYLKISRSYPIVTLKFLKNLNLIKGTQLENNKYSIVIWDNENLENLFESGQKLEVQNGKLFIHFNPRLCFDKVSKLANLTSKEIENLENSQFSNGDKISCNVTKLETEVVGVMENSVEMKWNTLKAEKVILEYVIYYIKAENQNIDMWTSRDTCGNDGWTAVDVDNFPSDVDIISFTLTGLQGFTQYAFYVKAYTSSKVAQSEVQYFYTLPGKPDPVTSLIATENKDSEISLTWKPPKNLNGEFEKYEIEIRKLQVMKDILKERNFCEHPFDTDELNRDELSVKNSTLETEKITQASADFEDEIQQLLNSRRTRSSDLDCSQGGTATEAEILLRSEMFETSGNEFILTALDHFSSYAITVRACRKKDNKTDEQVIEDLCSDDSQIVAKTLKSDTADFVENFNVAVLPSNTSEHQVKISWIPPKNPNGKVLHYVVIQKKIDEENGPSEMICISLFNRTNVCSQIIDKVKPGNYSFQIMASTLAGDFGNYSNPKYVYLKAVSHLNLITSGAFMALLFLIVSSVIAVFVYKIYKRNQGPELVRNFENFDYDDHPMN